MVRLLTLLLIPILLIGRPIPHSHSGSGIVEPHDHDGQTHVHLHSVDHSTHHAVHFHGPTVLDDKPANFDDLKLWPVDEHDADAIYLPAGSSLKFSGASSPNTDIKIVASWEVVLKSSVERECRLQRWHPPDLGSRLPIYLLTASLRL